MKVIIVGLGRMGYTLAKRLYKEGKSITIIDLKEEAFEKLGDEIDYKKIVGVGFDRDVLEAAEIDRVDAIVTSTSSDEVNVLIAQIARNIYNVPKVIARTYDSRKGKIYDRLGIETVSSNSWAADRILEMVNYTKFDVIHNLDEVQFIRVESPRGLRGRQVKELIVLNGILISAIERNNKTFIPVSGTRIEEGDILYFMVDNSSYNTFRQMLGLK